MQLMKLLLQLRNSMINSEIDYMLSPVSENGVFYDSRSCGSNLPIDADANGAYNIARKGHGVTETFTVRKISSGIGVERIFPVHSPNIAYIKVTKNGIVRRAKLYFLRTRKGQYKIKEGR